MEQDFVFVLQNKFIYKHIKIIRLCFVCLLQISSSTGHVSQTLFEIGFPSPIQPVIASGHKAHLWTMHVGGFNIFFPQVYTISLL